MPLTEEERKERRREYQKEYHKKYYLVIKEKAKARSRQWYKDNKERYAKHAKVRHEANKDRDNARTRKWNKENKVRTRDYKNARTRELCDAYVRHQLTKRSNLTAKNIPKSLIEAKRLELQMKRFIKEQENG